MKKISFLLMSVILIIMVSCKPSDEQITQAVQKALSGSAGLAPVLANVHDGVVTLSGEVESDELKALAASALSGISGVKSVVNDVTVKPKGPSPEELKQMADQALLTKVNENFATYKVEGITATANDGVVTLTGDVKRAELQNVMKAAMESGATKVENQMTIK
jgi:osmotically-inducible protein OsmY